MAAVPFADFAQSWHTAIKLLGYLVTAHGNP
jgi:hypothetical protein